MPQTIKAVVVDDDFMIAKLHADVIKNIDEYQLGGIAYNFEQTLKLFNNCEPDLILLDIFLPDHSGIELLHYLRSKNYQCDIILITAAKDMHFVEASFRLGIFDYLIKPFDLQQLENSLKKYKEYKMSLKKNKKLNSQILEDIKQMRMPKKMILTTKKGIDERTLQKINNSLNTTQYKTAEEVAKQVGVSRSTARNYLSHLVEAQKVEEYLNYGTVGRPKKFYRKT